MQRKASARWQGTTQEGSGTLSVQSGTAARHALLVQGAIRRRQGNQSGGAHRRRPCRLRFTMALSFTLNNAGFTATAIDTEARLTMDTGRRQSRRSRRSI